METNKNRIIHYRSADTVDNKAKLPSADSLDYGELAINYADGVETIAFKNSSDKIVEIRSNEYIEGIIKDNEEVIATSLTELNQRLETVEELSEDSIPNISGLEITSSGTLNEEQLAVLNNNPTVFIAQIKIGQTMRGHALFGRIPVGYGDSDGMFAANIEKDYYVFNYYGNTYSLTQTELALKSEIPNTDNFALKSEIPAEVTESTVSGWGFTKNSGTVTGVKINGTTKNPSSGVVDLGTVITSHQNISHLAEKTELPKNTSDLTNDSGFITLSDVPIEQYKGTVTGVKVNGGNEVEPDGSGVVNLTIPTGEENVQSDWNETNTSSDAYIKNKPTIPSAVTESTVSGWGFTKNTGTITEVKMNGTSMGTSGVVDLGAVITEHQDISGKQDTISDLETIRQGAAKGATAVQAVDTGDVLDDVNVDYATKTYVDDLVGDINSVLESIINS